MLTKFRVYQASIKFYKLAKELKIPPHLYLQLSRAAASISLNTAEGFGRVSPKDKKRFYRIALGSTRECQTILTLAEITNFELVDLLDFVGASLYKLAR